MSTEVDKKDHRLPWKYIAPESPVQGMEDWVEDADGNIVTHNIGSDHGPFICDCVNATEGAVLKTGT